MADKDPFREQTRQQIVKSIVNWSKSKQLWTFPKKSRFKKIKTECPQAFYGKNFTTRTNIEVNFTKSLRKIFEDKRIIPSPSEYQSSQLNDNKKSKGITFGLSRHKFNSYISHQIANNPGANHYDKFASQQSQNKKGYTFRPKTANHRNYFIDDKELAQVPSPSKYQIQKSDLNQSKRKFLNLGATGLMKKSKRFYSFIENPGPSHYKPKKISLKNEFLCGKMNKSKRQSFVDKIQRNQNSPGPGNYILPSQFGHYKKTYSKRLHTLQ